MTNERNIYFSVLCYKYNMTSLASGTYILELLVNNERLTKKVVKIDN